MLRFFSRDVARLACPALLVSRLAFSQDSISDLQAQVSRLRTKLQLLEESRAANALVALYSSRKIRKIDVRQGLRIFTDDSYHSPIFCHDHLPVILAHFITALDTLPVGLNAMPSILSVRETLLQSFNKLVQCDIPVTDEQVQRFRRVLEEIEDAHAEKDLLQTMAFGILELKDNLSRHKKALLALKNSGERWAHIHVKDEEILPYDELAEIQKPLDFCNQCMIAYNFLSRMWLNVDEKEAGGGRVGMVDLNINLESVVRDAVNEAKQICNDHYGDCPATEFVVSTGTKTFRFPYMSTTIRYIVVELMKNAFRATVDAHMKRNSLGIVTCDDMPPVKVLINLQEDNQHACIRISDEALGMTRRALEMAMAYSYTSVAKPALELDSDGGVTKTEAPSPLAGYGYGLPMSRIYARSFGGDIVLHSMEGYGTRAYYYIKL